MKKILFVLFFIIPFLSKGQVIYTQTFIDKCTGEVKIATTTYVNGNAVVSFYDQIKTFTNAQVQNGTMQAWLQTTYDTYNNKACPVSTVVQQTIQNTVSQAAAAAANTAAAAASSAASYSSPCTARTPCEYTTIGKKESRPPSPVARRSDNQSRAESRATLAERYKPPALAI